ncbi:MAG: hypothetical protein IT227_08295 [Flavobacteriales bacterium]|nr:hypothetical protein [Flavobacteriales bacterium]
MLTARFPLAAAAALLLCSSLPAQDDLALMAADAFPIDPALLEDPAAAIADYEVYNPVTGGDSVRLCNGHPCIGWVEDHHANGALRHKGYYVDGRLTLYKNHHPDGTLEREFRSVDALRAVLRTFHTNGQPATESRFVDGTVLHYQEHYRNGQLRYAEEKHKSGAYYERMDLFASDGSPISTLELVDKRRVEFLQREYHPGGLVRCEGRARYNPQRMDTQRIGTWTYRGPDGSTVRTEEYVDGKVHAVR